MRLIMGCTGTHGKCRVTGREKIRGEETRRYPLRERRIRYPLPEKGPEQPEFHLQWKCILYMHGKSQL